MNRDAFKSRLGFIMVSAGCAIGIGNVWKFPYLTGSNGGGVFVLIYIFFLLLIGIPLLTMELALGRSSRNSIVGAYKKLEPKGTYWHIHGWICIIGCIMLMLYYTTVNGWMLLYFYKYLNGQMQNYTLDTVDKVFGDMLGNPVEMTVAMAIVVILGFIVCSFGIQGGLERITKYMMLCMFVLILGLAIYSCTLEGAKEGISFYLKPDLSKIKEIGFGNVVVSAMSQAMFTLSIGIGNITVFGSYMSDDNSLYSEGISITLLDTVIALISGLIIFPACFSYNVEPDSGPSLIFLTLPKIFSEMNNGRIFAILFFLFMFFASFSTVITVFEGLISSAMDNFGMTRGKAVICNLIIVLIGSLPSIFGYNIWSGVRLIGGRDILDSEDFLVSGIILPIGALIILLFCTAKFAWGFDKYADECDKGKGMKTPRKLKLYFSYVLPLLMAVIIIGSFF
ncbi:MAG: sodium-dependent transporter [Lachnospiraceae bacterium]|nr:sodium-dependent transporter [Lachnospiraceae bacterium]